MPGPSADLWNHPVTELSGVGPERAALLARLEIRTVGDLLRHRPRRYEDRRQLRCIGQLVAGEAAATHGRIVAQGLKTWKHGARSVFEFILEDGTGRLHCCWWNLPYMQDYFQVGDEVLVYGKLRSLKPRTMDHPETEVIEGGEERSIHLNRIVPVYPLTEGLAQRWLRGLLWRTLEGGRWQVPEPQPAIGLPDRPSAAQAIRWLHFPETTDQAEQGRCRLALDEYLSLQIGLEARRRNFEARAQALPCAGTNRLMKPFLGRLGFELTEAQKRVLREIRRDLGAGHPMRRLLQGDVGSGKTVVAAAAALMAIESGFDVALMAPTEILAEQHARTFGGWFAPLGVPVALCTGNRKIAGPGPVAADTPDAAGPCSRSAPPAPTTADRNTSLTAGTHALLESGFAPENLGLVIIDEQHKFGVAQREQLVRKGRYPHLLVMTATPIPRTLGLTLYGDLDLSVIDALPAGRGRIRTFVRGADRLPKVWEFVRQRLAEGRQAYVVYPRVEDTDLKSGLKAVLAEYRKLETALAPHRVGLLHGRQPAEEKERVMSDFRANRLQALVATSVIEVGVDVPNATVMVIENAESYGLAQLHQLRGRIGRSAHDAQCILIAAAKTDDARRRLKVLEETHDGFRIAEADLRLRGPGELLGREQSGMPAFRFGELDRDLALIQQARDLAKQTPAGAS